MTTEIYPWQCQQWEQLITIKQQQRLPHALLFIGAEGLGKKQLALKLAHLLLCGADKEPCGQCHACHLVQAQSHPDLLLIEPEQQLIKVDQIRGVVQFLTETALKSRMRIVVINPAHAMNINAANALLKTLEEPAPDTCIILISDQNLRLPITITSRCHKLIFSPPTPDVGTQWLQTFNPEQDAQLLLDLAGGAPLRAQALSVSGLMTVRQMLYAGLHQIAEKKLDPLALVTQCQETELIIILNLLWNWLQDLLRCKLTRGQGPLLNHDFKTVLVELSMTKEKLLDYVDHVQMICKHIKNSLNLNRQLVLEELFILWAQYATC